MAGLAGPLGWLRKLESFAQGNGAAVGYHQSGPGMDQQGHRALPRLSRGQSPTKKGLIGWSSKGEECPAAQCFGHPIDHAAGPAVDGITCPVTPFRTSRQMRPIAGLMEPKQQKCTRAFWRKILRARVKGTKDRQLLAPGHLLNFSQICCRIHHFGNQGAYWTGSIRCHLEGRFDLGPVLIARGAFIELRLADDRGFGARRDHAQLGYTLIVFV